MSKIMIVDDSESLRRQLKRDLEKDGYQVVEAFDGVNALEVIAANPDTALIICDVNMPRMDGLTFASCLAEQLGPGKIPIFMLTTECNSDMKSKAKESGVIAWITKPYNPTKLLSAVSKVLARSMPMAA